MHTQLDPWLIPIYRPTGQSTELTLHYAEEAMKKREIHAKTAEIAQNKLLANHANDLLSDYAREKVVNKKYTAKELAAETLALHLLYVPKITESDIASFAKVVDCCYRIDLALARIGYNSFSECSTMGEHLRQYHSDTIAHLYQFYGANGMQFIAEQIDLHAVKPFTSAGLLHFLSKYAIYFHWVKDPEKNGLLTAEKQKITDECKKFCAVRKIPESEQSRSDFLKEWLKANAEFLHALREMREPISAAMTISRDHLTKLIDVVGEGRTCIEFSLPICVENEPGFNAQLKKYGFEQDRQHHFYFSRK